MQVKCGCGKLLKVPDSAAGKNVKCPACGKVFKVPQGQAGAGERIIVECACGKRLAVSATAAGKRVRCPGCKKELMVPDPRAASAPPEEELALALDQSSSEGTGDAEYDLSGPKCPRCGEALEPGAQFCVQCGTYLETGTKYDAADPEQAKQERTQGKKTALIIGLCLLGVLVLAGATVGVLYATGGGLLKGVLSRFKEAVPPKQPAQPKPAESGPQKPNPKASLYDDNREGLGYTGMVVKERFRSERRIREIEADRSVQMFEASEGRLPNDLEELQAKMGKLTALPPKIEYKYDPETGKVTIGGKGEAEEE